MPTDLKGKPLFVLTTGATDPDDYSYVVFEPASLTLSMIDLNNGGALKGGLLFFGCTAEICKAHFGGRTAPAKFEVKAESGKRAFGRDSLPRLKSLKAITGSHEHESEAAQERDAAKSVKKKVSAKAASGAKAAGGKSGQVNSIKSTLVQAAALAQAAPATRTKEPPSPRPAASAEPQEPPAEEVLVLRLPFDASAPYDLKVTAQQYEKAKEPKTCVSEDVFEALREIERQSLTRQEEGLSSCMVGHARILIVSTSETMALQRLQNGRDLRARFQRMRKRLKLQKVSEKYDLVSFGPVANTHFSEALWLPMLDKIYACDSCAPQGHYEVVDKSIRPFAEYLLSKESGIRYKDGEIKVAA